MKKIITALVFLICNNPLWCSQVVVGVDSDKIIIWEYWKFDLGLENHEMMIFNPSGEKVDVVFRKWYPQEENMPAREYLASDVLLRIDHLKPNDYALFDDPTPRMRKHYRGLIEVLINGESAGLYSLARTANAPANKIKEGIVINQIANVGSYHPYEIIYESQRFKRNTNPRVKVVFSQEHFLGAGFNSGDKFNPEGIELEDITTFNLEVVPKEGYNVYFVPTSKDGYFELSFVVQEKLPRVLKRNFFYQNTEKRGQGINFIIPLRVRFDRRRKYQ
jgi:hypothetical protein